MSKLGDIEASNGKEFKIAIANTSVETILESNNLPANTLIISAQKNDEGVDTDTSCLIITDNVGSPIRLTYQFIEGNGIILTNDCMYIGIDNETICENEISELYINAENIVDNNTLKVLNNKIYINTEALEVASETSVGLVKIDNDTIKINSNNQLYANTNSLLHATNDKPGISCGDGKTIITTDNGMLGVNTQNLDKATSKNHGVVIPDNNTIDVNTNGLHIVTANLQRASSTHFGIGTGDKVSVITNNGVLDINEDGIKKCTNISDGLIKINANSLNIVNDVVSLSNPEYFDDTFYKALLNELDAAYNNILSISNVTASISTILSLSFNSTAATSLPLASTQKTLLNLPVNDVYVFINIKTLADFTVNITFINNIAPMCEVKEIVFNNKTECNGNTPAHVFPSTNGIEQRLTIHLTCYNYKSNTLSDKAITSVKINIADVLNTSNNKTLIYSIIRYNTIPVISEEITKTNTTTSVVYVYDADNYESYWTKNSNSLPSRTKYKINLANMALSKLS